MNTNRLVGELLTLGIGTASLVADRLRRVGEDWSRSGRLEPEQAQQLVNELLAALPLEGNWEQQARRQFEYWLRDLGVPGQSEVDELRGRIDRLERQIRELESRP